MHAPPAHSRVPGTSPAKSHADSAVTTSSKSMMIDARSNDVARLRREWVAAYGAWTQVADDKALSSSGLTAVQRAALRRYRAAESAYFARLHATTDSELRT